jgi:uncharacterized protein YuzE
MTPIRIGPLDLDHSEYDPDADVLYLSAGPPRAGYGEETPEGHVLRFDNNDVLYGITLIGVKEIVQAKGVVEITPPDWLTLNRKIDARDLELALA